MGAGRRGMMSGGGFMTVRLDPGSIFLISISLISRYGDIEMRNAEPRSS